MTAGAGPVFFRDAKLSTVAYRVPDAEAGRQVEGSIQPLDGEPPIDSRSVPDIVNDRLTLSLECGCLFDFFVASHSPETGAAKIKGKRRLAGPAHEHQ